jgi:hypothetical protein
MWTKQSAIDGIARDQVTETWYSPDGVPFQVDVRVGKPLDVLALKGTDLGEISEYARFLEESGARMYGGNRRTRKVDQCPCCETPLTSAVEVLSVYQASYVQCPSCGHVLVSEQPILEELDQLFSDSDEHASAYTDPQAIEVRLAQIVRPKLDWMLDAYAVHVGSKPLSVVDVGAGGGHFVEVSRRAGLKSMGFELSRASRRFATENFGLHLIDEDFLTAPVKADVDIVTFWGLLEYTSAPRKFLAKARRYFDDRRGLLVVEVPRYDCMSTTIQRECPDTIARHMDPTTHVNCFTEASLSAALLGSGFRPVAAWYFGMDAYELLVQLSLRQGAEILERFAHLIPSLQASFDAARLCDDIIVAAVPC